MVREDIIEGDFIQCIHLPPPRHHEEQQVAALCVDLLPSLLLVSGEEEDTELAMCDWSAFSVILVNLK